MRAIANGQVDGFPPKDVLRTVYVEHDIDSELTDMTAVDFIFADAELQAAVATTREQVEEQLKAVGFDDALRAKAVGSLSGGWKMKLALGEQGQGGGGGEGGRKGDGREAGRERADQAWAWERAAWEDEGEGGGGKRRAAVVRKRGRLLHLAAWHKD